MYCYGFNLIENSKILYMDKIGFGGSQREKMDMVLEPMQVMIQLLLLRVVVEAVMALAVVQNRLI